MDYKDYDGDQTGKGSNPFFNVFSKDGKRLSGFVTCYDPPYKTSTRVYEDIEDNIRNV